MATQSILWTPLPNGFDRDGNLRLSILASPRLDAETSPEVLASFGDFVDWPTTLTKSLITVIYDNDKISIAGNDTTGENRIDDAYGLPDSNIWKRMLPESTFVKSFAFEDRATNHVLSYSTTGIAAITQNLYTRLAAAAGEDLPEVKTLLNDPDWRSLINSVKKIDRRYIENKDSLPRNIQQQFDEFREDKFSRLATKERHLATFQLFHTPPGVPEVQKYENVTVDDPRSRAKWQTFKRQELPDRSQLAKRYDFHQIIAAMNQYPTLLRRMGLVVDLLIKADAFKHFSDKLLGVVVDLPAVGSGAPAVTRKALGSPVVHCRCSPDKFDAVPRPNPLVNDYQVRDGLLKLDEKRFRLLQMDVDGAGLKTMNTVRSLRRIEDYNNQKDPTTKHERVIGTPALRNAGLMLVQMGRGRGLKKSFERAQQVNAKVESNQAPKLYAEDLVRGFRIDIWDDRSKRWQSLCERSAHYDISGLPPVEVDREEGIVRLAATQSADKASNPDIVWLHEALMSWTGWSLCAPMPGRTVDPQDQVADAVTEVPDGVPLKTEFRVLPGSLPRLRLGRRYRVRARSVDLAANSLPPGEKDLGNQLPQNKAETYLRYEPVKPPALALVKPAPATIEAPAEGESMDRLAIRSFNDTPDKNTIDTQAVTRRFAVPDSASVKDAELHGMLDTAGKVDASFYAMLGSKDNSLAEEKVVSPVPAVISGQNPSPPSETAYAVLEDGGRLPYLPDPLCVELAARIFDLPGHDDKVIIRIPVYGNDKKWPHALPFKIVIFEETGLAPKFDEVHRELRVPLPKAARAKLRLSVKLSKEALLLLGIWQWLNPSQQADMEARALTGQHWMLTPWRTIELVHAVQKPLITPGMQVWMDRGLYQTHAKPSIEAKVSLKSTQQVDLMAEWNEPVAKPESAPDNRHRNDHAFSVKITDPQGYAGRPDHRILEPDLIQIGGKDNDQVVRKVHEFEDTRYRRMLYWLEATTRFREYMPPDILTETVNGNVKFSDKQIKVIGEQVETWVKNSAPPPVPEVLYVVPTFHWVRSETQVKQHSWRRGGGLRVYLDRPWYASGYGEMLAVVLPSANLGDQDPNTRPVSQPLKAFVSQWGNDPVWLSPFVQGAAPKPQDFPIARTAPDFSGGWLPDFAPAEEARQPDLPFLTTSLVHPQMASNAGASHRVDIAPHDVKFDSDRELWYCDIEIKPQRSYYPFIRMALARYQPVSVTGAHLSNIVLADFMTLSPDRWLTVNTGNDPLVRTLSVYGNTYTSSSGHTESKYAAQTVVTGPGSAVIQKAPPISPKTIVEVWIERFDPALGEDFGWHKEADAVVTKAGSRRRRRVSDAARRRVVVERARAKKLETARDFEKMLSSNLVGKVRITPTLWNGSIKLPEAPSEDTRFRLVIAEYEEYLTDDAAPYNPTPTTKDRRLVFVEHVELTG